MLRFNYTEGALVRAISSPLALDALPFSGAGAGFSLAATRSGPAEVGFKGSPYQPWCII